MCCLPYVIFVCLLVRDQNWGHLRTHKVNFLFLVCAGQFSLSYLTYVIKSVETLGHQDFFSFGNQSQKKMVYKQQNAWWRVRSGDKTTKCRHLCIHHSLDNCFLLFTTLLFLCIIVTKSRIIYINLMFACRGSSYILWECISGKERMQESGKY